jgi:hypothetical protein
MASNIDPTKPVAGTPTTSSVRANFQAAKDEIEALQSDVAGKANLAGGQNLTGGFTTTVHDFGSVSSGSITPNPSDGAHQKVGNNGAFQINATAESGSLLLKIANGGSAGSITFSGFEKALTGDSLTTTNGHNFIVFIFSIDGMQFYQIKALQ